MTAPASAPAPLDVVDRFDGAAAWAALPEAVRTAIGATVLAGLAADELVQHGHEVGDARYSRVGLAAEEAVSTELQQLLGEVIVSGLDLPSGAPRIPSLLGMVCEACGCSEADACPGGCGWARDNLCTACAPASAG